MAACRFRATQPNRSPCLPRWRAARPRIAAHRPIHVPVVVVVCPRSEDGQRLPKVVHRLLCVLVGLLHLFQREEALLHVSQLRNAHAHVTVAAHLIQLLLNRKGVGV
jgi:hypothetical protein